MICNMQHETCNGTQALGHNFAHTLLDDCYAVFYTAQQLGLGTIPCVPSPCRMGYRVARHTPLHCALEPQGPHTHLAEARDGTRIHPRALLALIALSRSGELRPARSSGRHRHGTACPSVWLFVCLSVRRFLCLMR